jgi:lipoprotein-anchoring transpeptidase ErfK/SrfK
MNDLKKAMIAVSCLVLSVVPGMAQAKTPNLHAVPVVAADADKVSDIRQTPSPDRLTAEPMQRVIVVSLKDRKLALLEDGAVKKVYRVAVGRNGSPSPTGTFTILVRVENPTYYHAGQVIPPGPGNPVGTRWIGLDKKGYGIHGTNAPGSIGKAASHGCIRMDRRDLEELFAAVRSGDQVEIVGERNDETASIFGTTLVPGSGPAETQTAAMQTATAAQVQNTATEASATGPVPASR